MHRNLRSAKREFIPWSDLDIVLSILGTCDIDTQIKAFINQCE